jgi:uncharacterized membrane protein
MPEPIPDNTAIRPGRTALVWSITLTLGALAVSAYLSYVSLKSGQSPAGCGSGSGCAQVLASKWSRWLGVPVSLLASLMYLAVLAALPAAWSRNATRQRVGWFALTCAAAGIVGSASWFTYLQLFELHAVCPYCMAGHALGLALAGVLLCRAPRRRLAAVALGLAGVAVIAVVQINTAAVVGTLGTPAAGRDTDLTTADRRTVTLLDGRLDLTLQDEPLLGEADAPRVLAVMFDYACPHCRHTHGVLQQVRRDHPDQLVVVALPTPLNRGCNPHAPAEMPARFDESCELAQIALAVYLADPSAFEPFDRWMFDPQTPRTAAQARDEAIRRVGAKSFEQTFSDPRTKQMIARNVYAYGQSGADRVPVLIAPGAPVLYGRVDDPQRVADMLGLGPVGGSQ